MERYMEERHKKDVENRDGARQVEEVEGLLEEWSREMWLQPKACQQHEQEAGPCPPQAAKGARPGEHLEAEVLSHHFMHICTSGCRKLVLSRKEKVREETESPRAGSGPALDF